MKNKLTLFSLIAVVAIMSVFFIMGCGDDGAVNLPSPAATPSATIVPDPTPGITATISGTVYGTDGEPADGITVRLTPLIGVTGSEGYGEVQTCITSNGGHYSFSVSYACVYLLEALNGGTLLDSQECNVSPGATVNVILGNPSNAGSLRVKVTADGSTPIEGATLSLTETLETSDYIEASYYYSEGWYVFEHLFLKDYLLTVNAGGYQPYTETVIIGVTSPPVEKVVTLTAMPALAITGFSPLCGSVGELVTIEGTGFAPGNSTVKFNDIYGVILSTTNTEIQVYVPEGATTGPISVTTPGGTVISSDDIIILGILINGGQQFGMVSGGNDPNASYQVILSPYYMGKFEVTNAEYVEFLNEEGNQIEGDYVGTPVTWIDMSGSDWLGIEGSFPNFTVKSGYANRPVVFVSWYGAVAYCNWLSEKHGLVKCYGDHSADGLSRWGTNGANYQPENNGYRLATEAEWEYGCRGGTTTDFNWGGNYTGENMSPGPIDSYCWYCYNSSNNHHDVTTLLPNSWDLYHMHGNVWEWCSDWYDGTYYQYCDDYSIVNNPLGLETGSTRVLRGGGWDFYAFVCRSSDRSNGYPGVRSSVIGFRLVRSN